MIHALKKIFIQLIVLAIKTNNKTLLKVYFKLNIQYKAWQIDCFGCQTGGHLLVPRPACLAYVLSCSMLPDRRASSGSSARLPGMCVVVFHSARQAGIFWFLGPPAWHVCCRVPFCQTGGHLLVPRPACLACVLSCSMLPDRRASSSSSARLSGMCVVVLHSARQAGIFWFLGPPVWHVCCRVPFCQTGGHLLVPRPACLACVLSCSILPDRRASSSSSARLSGMCVVVLHSARQAGIFWFLGPPVWHVCCRVPFCQTGGHLLVPRPACLACVLSRSMAARQAGIFWFLGPPVWHVCCRVPWLPDRRASSGSSARLSDSFSCRSPFPCGLLLLCVCNCLRHAECRPGDVNCL